jgi:hypothetical protein
MTLAAEKELAHIGETSGCADHEHYLVLDLSRRLVVLWVLDKYLVKAVVLI